MNINCVIDNNFFYIFFIYRFILDNIVFLKF